MPTRSAMLVLLMVACIATVAVVAPRLVSPPTGAPSVSRATLTPAERGVSVCEVQPEGPAARAGLQRGDRLVRLGDRALASYDDLAAAVYANRPGDRVALAIADGSSDRIVSVTLGSREGRAFLGLSGCPPG